MKAENIIDCFYRDRGFYGTFNFNNTFCAGNSKGEGICVADSGNGFFKKELNNQYYLYGIASVAPIEYEINSYCKIKDSAIFIFVPSYIDWIQNNWF